MTDRARLFLAIPVTEELTQELSSIQNNVGGIRWIPPRNFHITLKFFDLCSEEKTKQIIEALSALIIPTLEIKPKHLTIWHEVRSYVLLAEQNHEIIDIKNKIDHILNLTGLECPNEHKPFNPHITIAKFNKQTNQHELLKHEQRHSNTKLTSYTIQHITLYNSYLEDNQRIYQEILHFPNE
jgi:2'-5' RNA ligase